MPFATTPQNLLRFLFLGIFGGVVLITLGLGAYLGLQSQQQLVFQHEENQRQAMQNLYQRLDVELENLDDFISYRLNQAEELLKARVREEVDAAYATARGLYAEGQAQGLDTATIKSLIIEALRDQRPFEGRGYYFIDDLQGQCILLPTQPQLEGTSLWDNRDDTGHYIMRGLLDAVANPDQAGYSRYRWYRPDQPGQMAEKIAYVRLFEPLGWLIGSGDYLYQMEEDLQQKLLQRIESVSLPGDGYVAVIAANGRLLTAKSAPDALGKPLEQLEDQEHRQLVESFLRIAEQGGGYTEYLWQKQDETGRFPKLARILPASSTDWILIAGIYLDDLEEKGPSEEASPLTDLWQLLPRLYLPLALISFLTLLLAWWYVRWLRSLFRDYQERIEVKQQELERLANFDTLTGLPSRRLLVKRIYECMEGAAEKNHQFALLVIDIDRFKNINDSLGHSLGDKLLKQLAQRLKDELDEKMLLSRMGGDEYLLVLPEIHDRHSIEALAEKLIQIIARPLEVDYHQLVVTGSIGIAIYPDQGLSPEALFRHADTAMYQAKARGRNRYCFYDRAMGLEVADQLKLENDLRQALEIKDQLQLYYQPQWDNFTGKLVGCEALVRWQHPSRGWVSPAEFIPLAEETGLILPLGDWILETAVSQLAAWKKTGLPDLTLAVNLSTAQVNRDLPGRIKRLLADYEVSPQLLELEVTETLLMQVTDEAIAILGQLKKTGIRIALDDFGTGYSSLTYLSRLPLDVLKIDKSFVDGLPGRQDDVVIARLIIQMAAHLGLTTLAEGVETEEQLEFLKSQGCHLMQGYLKARPLDSETFFELARQGNAWNNTDI
ncbi:bifunctional diguanylate cyclase/phosphodiesterase [Marinospirillum perlucidum]|uniref:bifunctional diguanylate cyclase/phosphodiesterase n=1 Tax=Marinospirillum perlucidum TaxID=1982602 RepID=UPI000DF1A739|nr:EAL domain-containing protein [Marinospirillum perlucidum]